jgi:hypothetical protein
VSQNTTAQAATEGDDGARWRQLRIGWFFSYLVCAGGTLGLAWLAPVVPLPRPVRSVAVITACLLLPLVGGLGPVLFLRRVPRRRRKAAWQLVVPLVAGVALGVFGVSAGERVAFAERGEWTDAVVVHKTGSRTERCDLRASDGRDISPSLSEGDGCEEYVAEGDTLRVRYDPEGAASPTVEESTASDGGLLLALFVSVVVMGTWGALRQSRWDREYAG